MAKVHAGRFLMGGDEFAYLVLDSQPPALPALTPAEREVAGMVRDGLTNSEIAARRGTSAHTVGNQLASIFDKLGVASRMELVVVVSRLERDP